MINKLTKFIILINLILLAGQFFMTSQRATDGEKITKLENQLATLSQQNADLSNQILDFSSISYVNSKAQEMELKPITVSFFTPPSVASAVNLPTVAVPNP